MNEFDDFDMDNSHGIFGGTGGIDPDVVGKINRVSTKISPQGLLIDFRCPNCRKAMQFTYEYNELAAIAGGVAPHIAFPGSGTQWNFDPNHRAFYPVANCGGCDAPLPVSMQMPEASQQLNRAVQQGVLRPQDAQGLMNHIQGVKQRAGV